MTDGKPDPEKVEILVDKIGAIVRDHVRAARGKDAAAPGRVIEAAREALNALASVGAFTVSGLPTSAGGFDFFMDAFRSQVAAIIEHKINPRSQP